MCRPVCHSERFQAPLGSFFFHKSDSASVSFGKISTSSRKDFTLSQILHQLKKISFSTVWRDVIIEEITMKPVSTSNTRRRANKLSNRYRRRPKDVNCTTAMDETRKSRKSTHMKLSSRTFSSHRLALQRSYFFPNSWNIILAHKINSRLCCQTICIQLSL